MAYLGQTNSDSYETEIVDFTGGDFVDLDISGASDENVDGNADKTPYYSESLSTSQAMIRSPTMRSWMSSALKKKLKLRLLLWTSPLSYSAILEMCNITD